jgi:hypothetical protein
MYLKHTPLEKANVALGSYQASMSSNALPVLPKTGMEHLPSCLFPLGTWHRAEHRAETPQRFVLALKKLESGIQLGSSPERPGTTWQDSDKRGRMGLEEERCLIS